MRRPGHAAGPAAGRPGARGDRTAPPRRRTARCLRDHRHGSHPFRCSRPQSCGPSRPQRFAIGRSRRRHHHPHS
ncbi:hypothetical protein D3I60_18760 [Brevibacterium permense]|nr:hypothetical protein [Brevibacterium permense]